MSCAPCKSTVVGEKSLPGSSNAYLVDSTPCSTPTGVEVDSCGLVSTPGFQPSCSTKSNGIDYIPSWIQNLTKRVKGVLLVKKGDALCELEAQNPGPVTYDGQEFSVTPEQTLTQLGGDGAVVADGFLPLAYADKQYSTDDDGNVVETEVYRHGIQQAANVGVGQMLGLTVDCYRGTVRQDVIEPEQRDLVSKGIPENFRRLAYAEEDVTDGCRISKVKRWFSYVGAVFGSGEIVEDKTGVSREPSLIPTKEGGFAMGYRDIQEIEGGEVEESAASNYRLAICKVQVDPDNSERIIGHSREFLPFPKILEAGEYDSIISRIEALESS